MSTRPYKTSNAPQILGVIICLTIGLLAPIEESRASDITQEVGQLQFLGEARLEKNLSLDGARIGGLSGITYDSQSNAYFVISDDPGTLSPARFFTLRIDLSDGALKTGDVVVDGVTYLKAPSGQQFHSGSIDAEGIAFTSESTLFLSSEGQATDLIDPFIREFRTDGSHLRTIKIPKKYRPKRRRQSGVRHNLAFESLCLSPSGEFLFTATENALIQDGPETDLGIRSPSRLLRYEVTSGKLLAEYLYLVEAVAQAPVPPDGFRVNGLVDLLAVNESTLLALERSYSAGVGNEVRLFLVRLQDATNIRKKKNLAGRTSGLVPVSKELVLDFADLGLELDNFEGLTWGPTLEDGRRTLIFVTDDNFNPTHQVTQFFAFAVDSNPPTISQIQGSGHKSPFEKSWVYGVSGIVTAQESNDQTGTTLWIQDPRGDEQDGTADAISVILTQQATAGAVAIGDQVSVSGRVAEIGRAGALTLSRIVAASAQTISSKERLPLPVLIGMEGRPPPTEHVDDDGLTIYEPASDGIDFFESLEGMRVALHDPIVVGPTGRFGDFTIITDRGLNSGPRTRAGGALLGTNDSNPERIQIKPQGQSTLTRYNVGDQFLGPIIGVLDYAFGNFRVLVTEPLPQVQRSGHKPDSTMSAIGSPNSVDSEDLSPSGTLTFATFNVENLGDQNDEEKFNRLAQSVGRLGFPVLIALQEVQDNTGAENDGTVAADQTFARLIQAIGDRGGPDYNYAQINPLDGIDGGQPGGNIRVGYLFDPARLRLSRSQLSGSRIDARIIHGDNALSLESNPALLGVSDPAFEGSRKPLVAEFWYGPNQIFAINVHLKSKRDDQPLFGETQPPQRATEAQRTLQVQVVADFVDRLFDIDPEANVIVLGDFNDHEFRSTIKPLRQIGLENLIDQVPERERYTYVYNGNSQVLDQVWMSPHLLEIGSPQIEILHINADFAAKDRPSDHDPIFVKIESDALSAVKPPNGGS